MWVALDQDWVWPRQIQAGINERRWSSWFHQGSVELALGPSLGLRPRVRLVAVQRRFGFLKIELDSTKVWLCSTSVCEFACSVRCGPSAALQGQGPYCLTNGLIPLRYVVVSPLTPEPPAAAWGHGWLMRTPHGRLPIAPMRRRPDRVALQAQNLATSSTSRSPNQPCVAPDEGRGVWVE